MGPALPAVESSNTLKGEEFHFSSWQPWAPLNVSFQRENPLHCVSKWNEEQPLGHWGSLCDWTNRHKGLAELILLVTKEKWATKRSMPFWGFLLILSMPSGHHRNKQTKPQGNRIPSPLRMEGGRRNTERVIKREELETTVMVSWPIKEMRAHLYIRVFSLLVICTCAWSLASSSITIHLFYLDVFLWTCSSMIQQTGGPVNFRVQLQGSIFLHHTHKIKMFIHTNDCAHMLRVLFTMALWSFEYNCPPQ